MKFTDVELKLDVVAAGSRVFTRNLKAALIY